jgi:C1A family cysteine protease
MPNLTEADVNNAIQAKKGKWKAKDNRVSRLPDNSKRLRLGVAAPGFLAPSRLLAPLTALMPKSRDLTYNFIPPPRFDLRGFPGSNYTTNVKDQSDCGSCVAFACVATVEHVLAYQSQTANPTTNLSEAHLFFEYGRRKCSQGWWPNNALPFFKKNPTGVGGVTEETYCRYTIGNTESLREGWQNARRYIASHRQVSGRDNIKRYISAYGSIVACLNVYEDFFWLGSGVYSRAIGNFVGNHCVSLVGYEDANSCWIGKNSWGQDWGDGGFFRIAYGQCRIDSLGCFAVIPG